MSRTPGGVILRTMQERTVPETELDVLKAVLEELVRLNESIERIEARVGAPLGGLFGRRA